MQELFDYSSSFDETNTNGNYQMVIFLITNVATIS
jgi:hypothetical protein